LWRLAPSVASFGLVVTFAPALLAQTPAPAAASAAPAASAPQQAPPLAAPPPPPPGAAYPAYPAASYPPAAYAPAAYPPPPPGYAYAYPVAPRPPENVPYEGGPVPSGYHVEDRARRGPTIAGMVIWGSAYVLGLTVASADNFPNSTGWLVVPVVGPWVTLASRHNTTSCTFDTLGESVCDSVTTDDDNTTRTFLILDGLTQATGAALFIYGLASPKKVLVHDFVGGIKDLQFTPAQVGRDGVGGFVFGRF
jgi:hypothetical protein